MKAKIIILGLALFSVGVLRANNGHGDIKLSPNPANNKVMIKIEKEALVTVELYSILGQKILSQTTYGHSSTLDIHKIPNGLYLVNVSYGNTKSLQRLKINHF